MMGKKGFASRKSEVEAARQKKVCWKI